MAGPVPKRSETRRRRNKPEGPALVKAPAGAGISWPKAEADWHPIVRRWYAALAHSGQAEFYEQSDVETAFFVAEMMHRNLDSDRVNGQLFSAVMSAMGNLLVTEGDRRRARVELERHAELASVKNIKNYRQAAE